MGLVLAITGGVASTAHAFPPQCTDLCSCSSSCATVCYEGTFRTTCADDVCVGACGFDETSPDASDEAAALDDASVDPSLRVCVAAAAPTAGQEPS